MSAMSLRRFVTLIGEGQASVGRSFRLFSIPDECKKCRLFNVCLGRLKLGRVYRIIEVRRINLPSLDRCRLTGERLIPVVVEEEPVLAPIPARHFIEGIVITYVRPRVRCVEVDKYVNALQDGVKVKILEEVRRVRCGDETYVIARVIPLD